MALDERSHGDLLTIDNLTMSYRAQSFSLRRRLGAVQAVADVSLSVGPGETVGLVGESGCGKSSLARTIVGLAQPSGGRILFGDEDVVDVRSKATQRRLRREIQIIFQDPYSSLNPRMTAFQLLEEVWRIHPEIIPRASWRAEAERLLVQVGLTPSDGFSYPRQFSGGQRQRICIARALAAKPKLIICDEAVASIDVSLKAQIINLLRELQRELDVSYLFISHDLGVIRHLCDRVAVMYLGKLVEVGSTEALFSSPAHPYTRALLSAAFMLTDEEGKPVPQIVLRGDVPSPASPPSGCRFRTRCWLAEDQCAAEEPRLFDRGVGHPVACHLVEREKPAENRPHATRQQTEPA
jgi:oligopeptide/dipeptide ABC transporter ATP-binding protein